MSFALDIIGDKWTLLVLRDILVYQKKYYREFLSSSERISTNILADRLKTLVDCGLLTREDDPANKSQAEYHATPKAEALGPVLDAMTKWGLTYGPERLRPPPGYETFDVEAARARQSEKDLA